MNRIVWGSLFKTFRCQQLWWTKYTFKLDLDHSPRIIVLLVVRNLQQHVCINTFYIGNLWLCVIKTGVDHCEKSRPLLHLYRAFFRLFKPITLVSRFQNSALAYSKKLFWIGVRKNSKMLNPLYTHCLAPNGEQS